MGSEIHGTGYLLTASVAAVGGYAVASLRYAPRLAELATRVDVAERDLYGQGKAIHELSEALRCLLTQLEGGSGSDSTRDAVAIAKRALARN